MTFTQCSPKQFCIVCLYSTTNRLDEDELINQKKCIDEILKGKTEEEDKKPNRAKKTSKEEKKIKSITKAQMNDLQTQM